MAHLISNDTLKPGHLIPDCFLCVETRDVGEVMEKISWSRPHRIELMSRRDAHVSRLSYVPLNEISLGHLATSVPIRDSLGICESAFIVVLVVRGCAAHHMVAGRFGLNPLKAAVHCPGQTAVVTTEGYFEGVSLSFRRAAMVHELENSLGQAVSTPLEFAPSLNMTSLGGIRLWRSMLRLCEILDQTAPAPQKLLAARQAERWMISHLIESHRHNYTRLLHRTVAAGPWQVRAAEEFIRANAAEPISMGSLASVAGVSARTLQHSFRRHRGMSPMQFLRAIRLECVRNDLLLTEGPETVAQAAAKWGFYHFGRFAAAYMKQYGESPSGTLRRGKYGMHRSVNSKRVDVAEHLQP